MRLIVGQTEITRPAHFRQHRVFQLQATARQGLRDGSTQLVIDPRFADETMNVCQIEGEHDVVQAGFTRQHDARAVGLLFGNGFEQFAAMESVLLPRVNPHAGTGAHAGAGKGSVRPRIAPEEV